MAWTPMNENVHNEEKFCFLVIHDYLALASFMAITMSRLLITNIIAVKFVIVEFDFSYKYCAVKSIIKSLFYQVKQKIEKNRFRDMILA